MRILFVPWSQPTHYMPMVPLAWALRAAGHDVRVAGQPHVAEAVKRSGLTIATVGRDYDFEPEYQKINDEMARYQREHPDDGVNVAGPRDVPFEVLKPALEAKFAPFVKTATAMADDLVPLARVWRPDLVVGNPLALAAPLVAEVAGVPFVTHLTGPAVERQLGLFPGSGAPPEIWADGIRSLYERYGVEVRAEYAAAIVDPCPASMQFDGIPNRMPIRFVPYNGSGDMPDWLLEPTPRRRICLTWGTTTTQLTGTEGFLVPQILKSLSALDVEIVTTVTGAELEMLGEAPDNVRVVERLPLHLLLPTCAAIVHQSGSGTTLTAAALGLPQVLVAGTLEQLDTAAHFAETGAGVALNGNTTATEEIIAAVSSILAGNEVTAAAARLRAEIDAQPSPLDVARSLEELAS
ncbi:UDP:flavonoid glycosyltransferase YjiC (YdhE family) [Nonomuraea polychroma]|uniref:UDP:flavonoid glycosyltransferase YjiC (YdhE family) n=1 Tax=Nonomuraea polychroma TaxID=46176 RepID=A0A438LZT9_9ACTN|nr:nucleotide disphospho-sugar-binding domain-containing protein [Nonomuraea polychroma]RVX38758.1 UDP:flavonoid glycosyltransferase YjiC (YdhE family) [Nonomuraea polychroma]